MNEKIKRMKEEIRRRGGIIEISDDLPDEIAERFLAQVQACPDCRGQSKRNREREGH